MMAPAIGHAFRCHGLGELSVSVSESYGGTRLSFPSTETQVAQDFKRGSHLGFPFFEARVFPEKFDTRSLERALDQRERLRRNGRPRY